MQKKIHEKYDLGLLKGRSNSQVAKLWGITRSGVWKIRKIISQSNPEVKKVSNVEKIKQYLLFNNGNVPSIKKMCRELRIHILPKRKIIKIANEIDIICKFYGQHYAEHGYHAYSKKKCRCDVCKLSNNLFAHSIKYFKRCSFYFIADFANKHLDLYKSDKSRYKSNFFSLFRSEFSMFLNTKNDLTITNGF